MTSCDHWGQSAEARGWRNPAGRFFRVEEWRKWWRIDIRKLQDESGDEKNKEVTEKKRRMISMGRQLSPAVGVNCPELLALII